MSKDQPHLLYEKRGPIAYLTLNRPETLNAISPRMMVELALAWEDFRDDETLRVAILTGTGERAFCAGADLATLIPLLNGARSPEDEWDKKLLDDQSLYHGALLRHGELLKPVVAAVNGLALGGGTELLIACDLRVVAANAHIGLTEVRWGAISGGGALTRLARQIPWCMAMEIVLTGEPISALEAHRVGLVNRVVAPEEVFAVADQLAHTIAANAPIAVRTAKEAILRTSGLTLEQAYALEHDCAHRVADSNDAREGPLAFVEKRAPVYMGR